MARDAATTAGGSRSVVFELAVVRLGADASATPPCPSARVLSASWWIRASIDSKSLAAPAAETGDSVVLIVGATAWGAVEKVIRECAPSAQAILRRRVPSR